jgi:NADH-quinone oxidoreductase subunit A
MGSEFTPIFLFILVAISVAVGMLATSLIGPRKTTTIKQMPYESGMDPIGDARQRFDVRYYLVAIVFLLFDVELLFLYPWAVSQWSVNSAAASLPADASSPLAAEAATNVLAVSVVGIPPLYRGLVFGEIVIFVIVLAAAFAYAWKKGVFEWR